MEASVPLSDIVAGTAFGGQAGALEGEKSA
jgi:hypothetical protein